MVSLKNDSVEQQLINIRSELPSPRKLNFQQKKELIDQVGIKTVKNILKAKKQLSISRIPFIFNAFDSQVVIDILHNDWTEFKI